MVDCQLKVNPCNILLGVRFDEFVNAVHFSIDPTRLRVINMNGAHKREVKCQNH